MYGYVCSIATLRIFVSNKFAMAAQNMQTEDDHTRIHTRPLVLIALSERFHAISVALHVLIPNDLSFFRIHFLCTLCTRLHALALFARPLAL